MRQEIKRDDASVQMTKRERLPNVSAGVEARNYTGDGSFRQGMFTLAMSVPWANGGKYKAEIARDEAKAQASRFDAEDYERTVREQLHKLLVMTDAARREALLYRDGIIPRSQSGLEAIRASWEAGRGNLTDVFEARRMLLEAQTMYARAVVEQYSGMAELVLTCGLENLQALQALLQTEQPRETKP
jgi:outer membrane protein TolC